MRTPPLPRHDGGGRGDPGLPAGAERAGPGDGEIDDLFDGRLPSPAVSTSEERRVGILAEETGAATGLSIDGIEPTEDRAGGVVGSIPERD